MGYSTLSELRKEIEKRLNQNLPEEIWLECEPYKVPPYKESDVNEVLEELESFGFHASPKKNMTLEAAKLRSDLAVKKVEEIVDECREKLFVSKNVPFTNFEDMGRWIDNQVKKQPPSEGYAPEYGYKIDTRKLSFDEFSQFQDNMERKPGEYGLVLKTLAVPSDMSIYRVVVSEGGPLDHLWWATKRISKIMDCQESQATALILLGLPPLILPLSAETKYVSMDYGKESKAKIIITIREPISDHELVKLYRSLREQVWGKKRDPQPPSEKDIELVRFLHNIPEREKPGWEERRREWNKHKPDWKFDDKFAFRMACLRARKKVYPLAPPWGFDQ